MLTLGLRYTKFAPSLLLIGLVLGPSRVAVLTWSPPHVSFSSYYPGPSSKFSLSPYCFISLALLLPLIYIGASLWLQFCLFEFSLKIIYVLSLSMQYTLAQLIPNSKSILGTVSESQF